MLPHPITTGEVLGLQKGGENAAVRVEEVGCCFLLQSWLLSIVGPRTQVPRRKQSLLLFCSAREGFDPVCIRTKPSFGTKKKASAERKAGYKNVSPSSRHSSVHAGLLVVGIRPLSDVQGDGDASPVELGARNVWGHVVRE